MGNVIQFPMSKFNKGYFAAYKEAREDGYSISNAIESFANDPAYSDFQMGYFTAIKEINDET